MNWASANTLDQMWRSPAFPMWLTVVAAGFFAVIALITLLRAEKSVANGALTIITLLAVGVALAATTRGFGSGDSGATASRFPSAVTASLPALACVDDLAGDAVLTACEKAVFGSPEATAAALGYAARQITRLTGFGDLAAANSNMTSEIEALRHAVEHDRYGLMAQVLVARDHCTPSDCAAFKSLTDRSRVSSNIEERTYDGLVARYSTAWNAPAVAPAVPAVPPVAALIPGVPTGRPTNAEFPSAASTPPVSIMTPEPTTASASRQPAPSGAATPTPSPRPAASPAVAAAKKQPPPPPPKPARTPAPPPAPAPATSLAPSAPSAPSASTD
jgi:hypothetical protein